MVTLNKAFDREEGVNYFFVKLADENNQELLRVYSADDHRLADLHAVVQRKTLRVDDALDEIMGP